MNYLLKFAFLPTLLLAFSLPSLAGLRPTYVIVPEEQVLAELSPAPENHLSSEIAILVWNTHKGEAGNAWAEDLRKLADGKQLVLLQEGMNDSFMPKVLESISQMGWLMAQNFYLQNSQNSTGIITGHMQNPSSAQFQRTKDLEPLVETPKLILITTYVMESGEPLLVANIHGINFTGLAPFIRQIDEIIARIKHWQGKVIFAGDFNTWSKERTNYLISRTKEVGLNEVPIHRAKGLVLDHIFVRGCSILQAQAHDEINSSDHKPLTANLDCTDNSPLTDLQ